MPMRTPGVLVALLVGLTLTVAPAAAAPVETGSSQNVQNLVDQLGLGDLTTRVLGEGEDAAPRAPSGEPMSSSSAAVNGVWAPVDAFTRGILEVGLELIAGFFIGVAHGATAVRDAMAVVGAAPAESAAIAAATLGILGLLAALLSAMQRYGGLGMIPLFSRIAKSELLEHGLRADIYELIKTNPGINVSEIARRLDVAWGTATHHLQKLRQERMVAIRVEGQQKCYFPNGGAFTSREMDVVSVLKSPNANRIARHLVTVGGTASHRDVSESLGLSPALVSFHMKKLLDAGLVARHRSGRNTLYTALEANLDPSPRPARHHV